MAFLGSVKEFFFETHLEQAENNAKNAYDQGRCYLQEDKVPYPLEKGIAYLNKAVPMLNIIQEFATTMALVRVSISHKEAIRYFELAKATTES